MAVRKPVKPARKPASTPPPAPRRQSSNDRGKLVKIGALWLSEGKNGKYLSGRITMDGENEIRILVFPNGYKEEAKHPDYVIYEPGEPDRAPASRQRDITDDDIPF